MTHIANIKAGGAAIALALFCVCPAFAAEPTGAAPGGAVKAAPAPFCICPASPAKPAESNAALQRQSGRGEPLTEQDLTATNSGNTIVAATVGSGDITLQNNALAGFSGVGNFVMNTGHNNNLQSSMSVTVIITK